MATNELKYRVDVEADVTGKANVDSLTNSVDALGKGVKQAGDSAKSASDGLGGVGTAAQKSATSFGDVNAAVVKYDALLRPVIAKTGEAGQAFTAVSTASGSARNSVNSLDDAFAKLNIRSAAQIKADILAVNQALQQLASNGKLSGEEFDRAFAAGKQQIARFRTELDGVGPAAEGTRKHADGLLDLFGKLGIAFSGVQLAQEFIKVNVEMEGLQRTFTAVTGSVEQANAEMDYAREVANRLALPVVSAGKAYADLMAATKGTAVEGQATRQVFEAVANAMSVAGKSSDDTQGALLALSQMASKGVVSMEELRGQLGERLPGALNAAASGFGITTAQLIKLTESGQVTAEQLFPALARGLDALYGATSQAGPAVETLSQKWDRFKNALAEAFKTVGDAGVVDGLKKSLEVLEAVIVSTSGALVVAGKKIGIFFAALAEGDIGITGFSKRALEAFAEVDKAAAEKLVSAAKHNSVLAAAVEQTGIAATTAAAGVAEFGESTAKTAKAAGGAADGLVRINVLYGELEAAGKAATQQAVDSAEARKAEGVASVALADALGTESDKRMVSADAARVNAEALRKVADERQADLSLAQRHLERIQEEIAMRGRATEAEKAQIDGLVKMVEARQNEADAAIASAQASAVSAAAAETEVLSVANNAGRVKELAAAYSEAKAAREQLDAQKLAGINVDAQLAAAQIQEAQAAALYRDALRDQTEQVVQNANAKQSQISIEKASITLAIEQQRTILQVAKARGDESGAIAALLRMKELEINLAELTAKAKLAEADAALAIVQAKRAELEASGEMTAAKEAELRAMEAAAQVKQVEAQIASEVASRLRELADAARDSGDAAGTMGDGFRRSAGDIDALGGAAERASGKIRDLKAAQGESSNVVNRAVSTQQIDTDFIARNKGLTGDAVKAFGDAFQANFADEMAALKRKLIATTVSTEGYLTEYSGSFDRAVEKSYYQAKSAVQGNIAPPPAAAAPASTHRVEITLAGKQTDVDTSSQDSAKALVDLLKDLSHRAL